MPATCRFQSFAPTTAAYIDFIAAKMAAKAMIPDHQQSEHPQLSAIPDCSCSI